MKNSTVIHLTDSAIMYLCNLGYFFFKYICITYVYIYIYIYIYIFRYID